MASEPDEPSATAGPGAGAAPASPPQPLWRRALPFVLGLGLIVFVVARLDLQAFVQNLLRVNVPLYLGFCLVFILVLLGADAFATALVYRRSVAPVRFLEFYVVRGAAYLPSILNHHVGQAFITYFLSRTHGVPLWRVAGATLLVYASWMGCLLGLACVALLLTGQPAAWLVLPIGAGVIYLAVIVWRPAMLARRALLAPLFEAGVSGHLIALVARLPHLVVLFVGTWVPFLFFDVTIPLSAALTYIPILMVASTLPLTPQGVGTRDVLAAVLFEGFAAGETSEQRLAAIAAATASFAVVITLIEVVIGAILMRLVLPRLDRARGEASPKSPEAQPEVLR